MAQNLNKDVIIIIIHYHTLVCLLLSEGVSNIQITFNGRTNNTILASKHFIIAQNLNTDVIIIHYHKLVCFLLSEGVLQIYRLHSMGGQIIKYQA